MDIDNHRLALDSQFLKRFEATVCATFMVSTRHHHFAAKGLHAVVDALVVRSHHHVVEGFLRLLIDTLNHGLAA